ncbi:MAG TPA: sortase [Candidatus Paceibacterota bacterium]|nr:sortase [Candidatus Paceibacterota bacterium]
MKKKTVVIWLLIVVVLVGVAGAGYYFLLLPRLNQSATAGTVPDSLAWKFPTSFLKLPIAGTGVPVSSAYSSIPAPGAAPSGLPVRLEIPIIGVDSFIEDAYITPQGAMEVPSGTVDVAWFALGPHPGQVGSAVIGGHFGIESGVPFVFYNLSKLKAGDDIYIVDDEGNTITFVVNSTALLAANADATTVFTSSDGKAHLNLITCEGIWNEIAGEYPDRTVVFTTEVSSEKNAAPGTTLTVGDFPRSLSVGDSGVDVSALQTALEQKGFLTMPASVATGYFGALTGAAVSAYQTSAGLTANGVFGSSTRTKLISDLATNSVLPYTGLAAGATANFFQTFIQSVESLYATPLNGIITFLLLIAIAFIVFKLIRR